MIATKLNEKTGRSNVRHTEDFVHELLPDILVGGALVLLLINRPMQLLSQVGDIVLAKAQHLSLYVEFFYNATQRV